MKYLLVILMTLGFWSCQSYTDDLQLLKNVETYHLKNGMTFILLPKKGMPIVAAHLRVKVGVTDESPEERGLAHVFEHMAFRGTTQVEDYYNTLKNNGAVSVNASTTYDFTNYYSLFPANKLELWAYIESDRIKEGSTFKGFDHEIQVILSERKSRIENDPNGLMMESFLSFAFDKSPYQSTALGTNSDILSHTPEKAKAFYDKYYSPARMVAALVGDFDVAATKKMIDQYFSDIPAKPSSFHSITPDTHTDLPKQKTIQAPFADRFWLAYARDAYPTHNDSAFDFLAQLLCEGENSLLHKKIVNELKLAVAIDCNQGTPGERLPSYFVISGMPAQDVDNTTVVNAIREKLETLMHEGIANADIERYQAKLEASFIYSLNSSQKMASKLSFYESFTGDWDYIYKYREQLLSLNSGELQRVLKTNFIPSHEILLMMQKSEVE